MNTLSEKELQLVEMVSLFSTCELAIYFASDPKVAVRRACKSMSKRFETPKMRLYAKAIYNSKNPLVELKKKFDSLEKQAAKHNLTVSDYFAYGAHLDGQIERNNETLSIPGNDVEAK